jgi:hypothetical protein
MKILEDLFSDMFEIDKVTDERLAAYGLDHLTRIISNNPGGVFTLIRTDTENALNAFGLALGAEGGNIGDRKGYTIVKNVARINFNDFISRKEGLVKSTFGAPSLQYSQFFPNGLTAFSRASDMGYTELVNNIVARATQYEADLGPAFKIDAIAKADAYINAEDSQTIEKSEVAGSKEEVLEKRAVLTRQLTINALTIALQFPLDKTKVNVYFDPSLLFAPHRKHIYKGKPEAGVTEKVADLEYSAGKFILMENQGATELTFQMHLNGSPVGNSFTLANGQELKKREDEFFTNADSLWVTNNGTLLGQYKVEEIA